MRCGPISGIQTWGVMTLFQEAFSGKRLVCCALTVLYSTYNMVGWSITSIYDHSGIFIYIVVHINYRPPYCTICITCTCNNLTVRMYGYIWKVTTSDDTSSPYCTPIPLPSPHLSLPHPPTAQSTPASPSPPLVCTVESKPGLDLF